MQASERAVCSSIQDWQIVRLGYALRSVFVGKDATSYQVQANGEVLALQHVAPAHTDSDIYVHFQRANVISMGDLFFDSMYPCIDPGTGATITGMIAAADKIFSLADNDTKIVADTARWATKRTSRIPGHAHHFARSHSEIEVRGKICPRSRRGEAVR